MMNSFLMKFVEMWKFWITQYIVKFFAFVSQSKNGSLQHIGALHDHMTHTVTVVSSDSEEG